MSKQIPTISLSPLIGEGQIRVVLSWPNGPKDLDLYAIFKVNSRSRCDVFFGKKICVGVELDIDNLDGGKMGVETITISSLGNYNYIFAVNKYIDLSNGVAEGEEEGISQLDDSNPVIDTTSTRQMVPDLPLYKSEAKISIYSSNFIEPVLELIVPDTVKKENEISDGTDDKSFIWWYGFCFNGGKGISSLKTINKLSKDKPALSLCDNYLK
jgi:hypothetical protein